MMDKYYDDYPLLDDRLSFIEDLLKEIKGQVKLESELWDNADIIHNWKVSARTLADWRAKGLIGYVQVGSKIWYPREARELFLKTNFKKTKREEKNEEEEG